MATTRWRRLRSVASLAALAAMPPSSTCHCLAFALGSRAATFTPPLKQPAVLGFCPVQAFTRTRPPLPPAPFSPLRRWFSSQAEGHETASTLSSLVTPDWLSSKLGDPNLSILDVRGEVRKAAVGADGYQGTDYVALHGDYVDGHIPGAVFVDWTKDIAHTDEAGVKVQLVDEDTFTTTMQEKGVSLAKPVVVYDNGNHLFSTRLWWALRLFGHEEVYVLDGGYARWVAEGRPVSVDSPCPLMIYEEWNRGPAARSPRPSYPQFISERVDAKFVLSQCVGTSSSSSSYQLIDARTAEQFNGATRRGSRGGHIPGAKSIPYKTLLVEGQGFKTFQSPDQLVTTLTKAGVDPMARSCVYCNGGVASTVVIFALAHFGTQAVNYDGSWNEWSAREDLPVSST